MKRGSALPHIFNTFDLTEYVNSEMAVEGKRLSADDASMPVLDLDAAMMGRAGRETLVELRRGAVPVPVGGAAADGKDGKKESDGEKAADGRGADANAEKPKPPLLTQYVVIIPVNQPLDRLSVVVGVAGIA